MHEFEFEVRISDQIQTVKMAVGRHLNFYSNITNSEFAREFALGNNTLHRTIPDTRYGEKIMEHIYAKFEVLTRKTDAALSGPSEGNACSIQQ